MDKENKDKTPKTTDVSLTNSSNSPDLDYFMTFAKSVKNSALAKPFKDEDGNVDEGAILANLVLGREMGFDIGASLMLGKQLNSNVYFSVLKGKSLGLDAITSMSKVYNISTKNGNILSLAVDIISKIIFDNCDEIEYVRDNEPTSTFYGIKGNYLGHYWNIHNDDGTIKNTFFIYNKDIHSDEELITASKAGKIIAIQRGSTNVTSLRLARNKNKFNKTFHYSLQDATDAELFRGFHSALITKDGKPEYITGKDNWNTHPTTMLRNRVTSIAGRIAVADKLQGSYSHDEAMEIVNVSTEDELRTVDTDYEEVKED
jgi:hypothetical protein